MTTKKRTDPTWMSWDINENTVFVDEREFNEVTGDKWYIEEWNPVTQSWEMSTRCLRLTVERET